MDERDGRLVVSRKPGERVLIGDRIVVEVLPRSTPGTTRLRITAPKDVRVLREELSDRA